MVALKIFLPSLSWVNFATADLRFASQPHQGYRIRNEAGAIPFVGKHQHAKYMIPSSFGYKKLGPLGRPGGGNPFFRGRLLQQFPGFPFGRGGGGRPAFQFPPRGQKYRNYDNFLRSNIDNEQDNRDFTNDPGRDHLPFRTNETEMYTHFSTDKHDKAHRKFTTPMGPLDLRLLVKPGDSYMVPLRWNNPHVSELEVNVWIMPGAAKVEKPVVIPIRKPACSGEGHQDNVIDFTIPTDFVELGSKIPGFKGCRVDTKPMCILNVYSHSVEPRMYSFGFPIVIPFHKADKVTTSTAQIRAGSPDAGIEGFEGLRDLCRSSADPDVHIKTAAPRWARLISDLYTHAYMNSDYSPYSGQQHELISKNLQAAALNKMWGGNRGELGKSILPPATKKRIDELDNLYDRTYKRYEKMANSLVKRIERGGALYTTGTVKAMGTVQRLANCFRCAQVGSTVPNRLDTNTYIPSFQLPKNMVAGAKRSIFPPYRNLINYKGQLVIYQQSLRVMMPFYHASRVMGILYQPPMLKTTYMETYRHATKHKKRDAKGQADGGVYAAKLAKKDWVESYGCPFGCLWAKDGTAKALINGATSTKITGECAKCAVLFGSSLRKPPMSEEAKQIAKSGSPPEIKGEPDLPVDEDGKEPVSAKGHGPWPSIALLSTDEKQEAGGKLAGSRRRRRRPQ